MKYLTRHKNQICGRDDMELERKCTKAGVVGKVFMEEKVCIS